MISKLNDYLYAIKIELAGNPLRDLNCYVIRSPERNLLIDTGFNHPECLSWLRLGIQELGLDMNNTDILATHFHSDHCGLAGKIVMPGCHIYMSDTDKAVFDSYAEGGEGWQTTKARYEREGFPAEILEGAMQNNPAKSLAPDGPMELSPISGGQELTYGNVRLQCVSTPGHTPGHICLYNEKDGFMILGDHVLFDITPNITAWSTMPDSLGTYLDSLKMIRGYDVRLPLPAHRECHGTLARRVDQLLLHHEKRLSEVENIIRENPGTGGYNVAKYMRWAIRANSWEDFPLPQKWFAVGEALSHIYCLVNRGRVHTELRDGLALYWS